MSSYAILGGILGAALTAFLKSERGKGFMIEHPFLMLFPLVLILALMAFGLATGEIGTGKAVSETSNAPFRHYPTPFDFPPPPSYT